MPSGKRELGALDLKTLVPSAEVGSVQVTKASVVPKEAVTDKSSGQLSMVGGVKSAVLQHKTKKVLFINCRFFASESSDFHLLEVW